MGLNPEVKMKMRCMKLFHAFLALSFLAVACRLPGMLPLTTLPDMETDAEAVLEILNNQGAVRLDALVEERYSEEEYSKPGTLTFTASVTNETPVYFGYGWCAVDEETLIQNFEHIDVRLYFNGELLGSDVVHTFSFTRPDGLLCGDFGVLLSNWEPGEYELQAVAAFDEQINDGLADYDAGDYVFLYNVTAGE
jgi:hypothetical protein